MFRVVRSLISIDEMRRLRFITVRMINGISTKNRNPMVLTIKICTGSDSSLIDAYPNTKIGNKSGLKTTDMIRAALTDRFLCISSLSVKLLLKLMIYSYTLLLILIRSGKKYHLFGWISGYHTFTGCFMRIIQRNTSDRSFGFFFYLSFSLRSSIPVCIDKSTF